MTQKIEISHRTIIFTVLFLISLWFLFQIRYILLLLFIGLLFMSAINPIVERLEKFRIPRSLSVILIYVFILSFLGLLLAGVIPPLVSQTGTLITRIPDYFSSFGFWGLNQSFIDNQINQLLSRLGTISADIFRISISIFGNFITFFALFLISFYLLLERKNLDAYLIRLFGSANNERALKIVNKIEKRLGEWVGAQLSLMFIVGMMTYVGLRLLGIDFALPLALLAGLLEIVPNIGPIIASIPAVLAGLIVSPLTGLAAAAVSFLVQQIENQIIVPQIMKKEVGVNPLITIFALMAGLKIGGALGAILAIPFVILIEILLTEVFASEKFKKA